MLARIFIMLFLVLVPFGVSAEAIESEAYFSKLAIERDAAFERASHPSKKAHAKALGHKAAQSIESMAKADKAKYAKEMRVGNVCGNIDNRVRDSNCLYHVPALGRASAESAYRRLAKSAHPEVFIGKKVHDDLIAMGLTSEDMDQVFHPLFNQILENLKLLEGDAARKHDEQWDDMGPGGSGIRFPDTIKKGDIFQYMSFRNGIIKDVIVDFDDPEPVFVFPLKSGKQLVWIIKCWNFAVREGPTPVTTKENEGGPPTTTTVQEGEVPSKSVEKEIPDDWELFISMGFSVGEADSNVGYGAISGAYFPGELMTETENGRLEFGIGGQASGWTGETHDSFKYDGGLAVAGPAVKYIDYSGQDIEARVQAGGLIENGHKDGYESERGGVVIGPSVSYNNYERQLAGEDWFPEWGIYTSILLPVDFDAEHSWQGQGIADTTELKQFNFLLNASYRQIIYKDEDWGVRYFTQFGYFHEDPTSQSISARAGIGDIKKRWFAGCGPNFDLMRDWNVELGCDVSVDVSAVVNQNLVESNMADMRAAFKKTNIDLDEESGMFTMPKKGSIAPSPSQDLPVIEMKKDKEAGTFTLPEPETSDFLGNEPNFESLKNK